MKFTILCIACTSTLLATGCAYRGAVYTEYNQTALDIRSSAASGAPVQVNFGYDSGVFAYVPKQNAGTNATQGEAVSMISWNNIATTINPAETTNLLRVDAGFITGITADVASAPAGSTVTIVAPGLTNAVAVSGDPGTRIGAATSALTVQAVQAVQADDQLAIGLANATDDGTGKVSQAKLDKLVSGTLIAGEPVKEFYGGSIDSLKAKLIGSWRPFIHQMQANNK